MQHFLLPLFICLPFIIVFVHAADITVSTNDVIAWTRDQRTHFQNNKFDIEFPPNFPQQHELKKLYDIIKKADASFDVNFPRIYWAQTLESLFESPIGQGALVFLNLEKANWERPIIGEVKYINDIRYQFVGRHKNDVYGVVAASAEFGYVTTLDSINKITIRQYDLKLEKTWLDSDETRLDENRDVWKVTHQGRQFIIKKHHDKEYSREIDVYEELNKIVGIGIYIGSLQANVLLEPGEPMDQYMCSHKAQALEFFKPLLNIMDQFHDKNYFHNDVKPSNIVVVSHKPYYIDWDSHSCNELEYGKTRTTMPYYTPHTKLGNKKADIRALGFTFFVIKHHDNQDYRREDRIIKHITKKGHTILLYSFIHPQLLAFELECGDKIDNIIAKMLKQEFENARDVIEFMDK